MEGKDKCRSEIILIVRQIMKQVRLKKSRRAASHYLNPLSLLMENLSIFALSGNRKCSR